MEEQKIYSVRDAKADAFLQPFFAVNDAVAIRLFTTACMDDDHLFSQHAEDYTLFRIGTFDPGSGAVTASELISISRAFDLVRTAKPATPMELVPARES